METIISGKVTDSTGEALTGSNVFISDAKGNVINPPKGAVADVNGNFKIKAKDGQYITASFVGMQKQTKKVCPVCTANFVLSPSIEANLKEIEIIADKPKSKPKFPVGLVVFLGLTALTIVVGMKMSPQKA